VQKSQEQQTAHSILKKLANVADQAGVIEAIMGSKIAAASPEALVDELARCFLSLQAALKTATGPNRAQVSGLIEALVEIARAHGISPSLFYPALLERVLANPDPMRPAAPRQALHHVEDLDCGLVVFSQKGFHSATRTRSPNGPAWGGDRLPPLRDQGETVRGTGAPAPR